MPVDFLTQTERQHYQQPTFIAGRDLRQHFHLSETGLAFGATFRGVSVGWAWPCTWACCATWGIVKQTGKNLRIGRAVTSDYPIICCYTMQYEIY